MGYDIALGFSEIVMITVRLKYFLVLGKIQPDKIRVAENESMPSSSDFSYQKVMTKTEVNQLSENCQGQLA